MKQVTWRRVGNRTCKEIEALSYEGGEGRKRSTEVLNIPNGLPNKKGGVIIGDEKNEEAEAGCQPCQLQ